MNWRTSFNRELALRKQCTTDTLRSTAHGCSGHSAAGLHCLCADCEQQQELESYLEMAAEDFAARGMNPAEAHRAARIKLGNTTLIHEEIYTMNTPKLIDTCVRHARQTMRTLRRNPTFAGAAILTLALAIGANTAVFTVVTRPTDPLSRALLLLDWPPIHRPGNPP